MSTSCVEVTIERILPGGLGLAHADGRTLMVALAAPGDHLKVQIDRVKGNVAFASIKQIIEPSPVRVEAPCPYFGRCGGCDFQQLNYQAQLDAKVEIIKDCLRRIGHIENLPDFQITPAPNPWHYRARAQWQYDSVRQRLGYFESGSRRVCDVAECAVLVPALQQTLESLRARMHEGSLPEDARDFRAVVGDNEVSVAPGWGGGSTPREGLRSSASTNDLTRKIGGDTFRLNAESFFQTNADLLPELIDAAIGEARGETAVELYCGVGLFTLALARRFNRVTGVEDNADAADFARENLKQAEFTNARIANQRVANWLEDNFACAGNLDLMQPASGATTGPNQGGVATAALQNRPDFLLLDPPRTGAESRVILGILKLKPARISYVSCDPATLARDLRKLIAGVYALDSIAAFDMFPQTHHVETVVHLMAPS